MILVAVLYDAVRKSAAALLQAQGLRATSKGGRIAIQEAVLAQFGRGEAGGVLRRLGQMRRRRNDLEYPDVSGEQVTADELAEATTWAATIVGHCQTLMPQLGTWVRDS